MNVSTRRKVTREELIHVLKSPEDILGGGDHGLIVLSWERLSDHPTRNGYGPGCGMRLAHGHNRYSHVRRPGSEALDIGRSVSILI